MIKFGLKAVEKVAEPTVRGLGATVLYHYLGKLWEKGGKISEAARCFREAQKEAEKAGNRELAVLAQLSYAALCGDLCDSREKVDRQLIAALKAAEEQNLLGDMTALKVRGELALSLLFKGETDEALRHLNFLDAQKDRRMDKISQAAWAVAYELSEQQSYAPSEIALAGLDKAVEQEGADPKSDEAITVHYFLTSLQEEWEDLGLNKHVERLLPLIKSHEWED